jgi:hypothetical protein
LRKHIAGGLVALALGACGGAAVSAGADDPGIVPHSTAADTAVTGGDHYYMIILGYQNGTGLGLNRANKSHTFGTFVHTQGTQLVDQVDFSWIPAQLSDDLTVCVGFLGGCDPVLGHNYTLNETLGFAEQGQRVVRRWGPYEVTPDLYAAAQAQHDWLDTGNTYYIAVDNQDNREVSREHQQGGAINCMHAISDMITDGPMARTGINFGFPGSRDVLHYLSGFIVQPVGQYEWVAAAVGVQQYDIGNF